MKVGEFFDKWNDYVKEFDRNLDNEDVDIEDYDLMIAINPHVKQEVSEFEIDHERKEVILK
jgi:hypothetical protein